jgi:hypothetical protein
LNSRFLRMEQVGEIGGCLRGSFRGLGVLSREGPELKNCKWRGSTDWCENRGSKHINRCTSFPLNMKIEIPQGILYMPTIARHAYSKYRLKEYRSLYSCLRINHFFNNLEVCILSYHVPAKLS